MAETKKIQEIFKPEHQLILENEHMYSIQDVFTAKKHAQIERDEAERLNITINDLRLQKQIARQLVSEKIKEQETAHEQRKTADLKTFGNTCVNFMMEYCKNNNSDFKWEAGKTQDMYREIIRYFYWDCECEKLDKKRYLYLFGVYGCGKSVLVKSILKAFSYHHRNDWQYFHLPTLTKNYMSQSTIKNM